IISEQPEKRELPIFRRGESVRIVVMFRMPIAGTAAIITLVGLVAGQSAAPRIHRLEATPTTIAYGYYWTDAKPVLRIASGDIIDVDTLLTNTPAGLTRAGVADDRVQASL